MERETYSVREELQRVSSYLQINTSVRDKPKKPFSQTTHPSSLVTSFARTRINRLNRIRDQDEGSDSDDESIQKAPGKTTREGEGEGEAEGVGAGADEVFIESAPTGSDGEVENRNNRATRR